MENLGWVLLMFLGLIFLIGLCISLIRMSVSKNESFIKKAIPIGWKFTKKYFGILILLWSISCIPSLASYLFNIILYYIPGATLPSGEPQGIRAIITPIISIITGVIGARLGLGLTKTNLMTLEDKKPVVKDLCVPFIYVIRFIGGVILEVLIIALGLTFFIIPGIYIATRFSLSKYFIAEGYGAIDAIKASWAVTQDNVWKLIGISFLYFGIVVLGVLALGIGLLRAIPTIMLAQAYVYTQLKKNLPETLKPIH